MPTRRPLLSRQHEVELRELLELCWRGFVVSTILCAGITPWVVVWILIARWLL